MATELFKRVLFDEHVGDIAYETWENKIYNPRLEYGRKQLEELKANPYPEAKTNAEKMQAHVDNMQRIAVSVISETLENMSHQKCCTFLQNQERLEQIVYDGTQQAVECPDINTFYAKMRLKAADAHKTLCRNICLQITSHWNDYYARKNLEVHDPLRFQKHFLKNLAPLTASHAIADGFAPDVSSIASPPPMVPLEKGFGARKFEDTPLERSYNDADLLEPPPLVPLEKGFGARKVKETSLEHSHSGSDLLEPPPLVLLEDSLLDGLIWEEDAVAQLPPVPAFKTYAELEAEEAALDPPPLKPFDSVDSDIRASAADTPPSLRWSTPVDSSIRGSADDARRRLARQKLRPVGNAPDTSIAVGWLKDAIARGEIKEKATHLVFFAPSNQVVATLNKVDKKFRDGIIRNALGRHLCVTNHSGSFFSIKGNKPIRVQGDQIVQPTVKNPKCHTADIVKFGPYTISCFAHENLIDD